LLVAQVGMPAVVVVVGAGAPVVLVVEVDVDVDVEVDDVLVVDDSESPPPSHAAASAATATAAIRIFERRMASPPRGLSTVDAPTPSRVASSRVSRLLARARPGDEHGTR
jgi:hypothetical protein